jgi:hypothetical protein
VREEILRQKLKYEGLELRPGNAPAAAMKLFLAFCWRFIR